MNEIRYLQLPGSSGIVFRKTLYLGPDHVLSVESNVASQEYRRFYFNEIQALLATPLGSSARIQGFLYAVLAGAFAFVLTVKAYELRYSSAIQYFWAGTCWLACIGLLLFAFTRPTARCSIKTRAGTQFLRSLKSMERVRSVAAILKTEIDKAQGRLPEELPVNWFIEAAPISPDARRSKPWLYYAAFGAMLIFTLFWLARPDARTIAYNLALEGLHMSLLALTLAAIGNRGDDIQPAARIAVVLTLAWTLVSLFAAGLLTALETPFGGVRDISGLYWAGRIPDVANANAIAYAVFGVAGMIGMFARKRRVRPA